MQALDQKEEEEEAMLLDLRGQKGHCSRRVEHQSFRQSDYVLEAAGNADNACPCTRFAHERVHCALPSSQQNGRCVCVPVAVQHVTVSATPMLEL